MAWIDDRIWCHPKVTDVSPASRWIWVASLAYSSGMQTGGTLTAGQQTLIGSTAKSRRELVGAELWDNVDGSTVTIHDWDNHNGKRDDQRGQARERKRRQRAKDRDMSRDPSRDNGVTVTRDIDRDIGRDSHVTNGVTSRGRGRASREGSEGSDKNPRAVTSTEPHAPDTPTNGPGDIDFTNILKAVDW